ncbi:unnamed protein product [Porites lobata]|uniref:G-protein coupled receptors family 1 profile domain-containing protein n=1 Tax=Porites lobata TaxID=104759 RepID=A0ABN8SC04_9CNID|nr:unnamed protein product [Porites lobata]
MNNNKTVTSNEIRLSKSLFVVVFAFMLCWVPTWVITILTRLVFGNKMPRNVQLLCTFFLNISNAVNPFTYAGMNPIFRREFRKLLGCKFGVRIEISLSRQSSSRRPATSWISSNHNITDKTGDEQMERLDFFKLSSQSSSLLHLSFRFFLNSWLFTRAQALVFHSQRLFSSFGTVVKFVQSNSRMVNIIESGSTALKVIEAGAMIVLNILSLLGNILVCLSVYRNSSLRTTTNLYIIALAVTDLIAATLVMPPASGVLITGRWPFGVTVCQIHAFFSLFVVYVSPVTMGLTALNRYIRICKSNQQYNLYFSKKKSLILLGSAWTFCSSLHFNSSPYWSIRFSFCAELCSLLKQSHK